MSIKSLSLQHLQRNQVRNYSATTELRGGSYQQADFDRSRNRLQGHFDPSSWQQIISDMVADFGHRDPRAGCWQLIQSNHPDLWREQMTANREIDQAYGAQDALKIKQAVSRAKDTFSAMLQAFEKRNHFIQPTLVAA